MNDADMVMVEMTASANRLHRAERAGRCAHFGTMRDVCDGCGTTFPTNRDWGYAMACVEDRECWDCGADATQHDGRCGACHDGQAGTVKAPSGYGNY